MKYIKKIWRSPNGTWLFLEDCFFGNYLKTILEEVTLNMNYFDIGTTVNNISTILCLSSSWFIEMRLKYFLKVVTNIFRLSCVQKCQSSRFFRNFGLRSFFWQYSGLLQGESLYLFSMQNNVLCWQDLNDRCLYMRKFVNCALQISVLINEKS